MSQRKRQQGRAVRGGSKSHHSRRITRSISGLRCRINTLSATQYRTHDTRHITPPGPMSKPPFVSLRPLANCTYAISLRHKAFPLSGSSALAPLSSNLQLYNYSPGSSLAASSSPPAPAPPAAASPSRVRQVMPAETRSCSRSSGKQKKKKTKEHEVINWTDSDVLCFYKRRLVWPVVSSSRA